MDTYWEKKNNFDHRKGLARARLCPTLLHLHRVWWVWLVRLLSQCLWQTNFFGPFFGHFTGQKHKRINTFINCSKAFFFTLSLEYPSLMKDCQRGCIKAVRHLYDTHTWIDCFLDERWEKSNFSDQIGPSLPLDLSKTKKNKTEWKCTIPTKMVVFFLCDMELKGERVLGVWKWIMQLLRGRFYIITL